MSIDFCSPTEPDSDGIVCTRLDIGDAAMIEAYEKALFRAFPPGSSTVTDAIWTYDRKNRRVFRMAYDKHTVYLALRDRTILASMAINSDLSDQFQCERVGFTIDRLQTGIGEGAALFSTTQSIEGSMSLRKLGELVFADLKRMGISRLYGTCTERLFRLYGFMGWKVVDELSVPEGRIFLIGAGIEEIRPV